jgi:hypothetical protein
MPLPAKTAGDGDPAPGALEGREDITLPPLSMVLYEEER